MLDFGEIEEQGSGQGVCCWFKLYHCLWLKSLSYSPLPFEAQLLVETDTFGSQVRIKGKETEFYLCMNRKGKLVGKVSALNPHCLGLSSARSGKPAEHTQGPVGLAWNTGVLGIWVGEHHRMASLPVTMVVVLVPVLLRMPFGAKSWGRM